MSGAGILALAAIGAGVPGGRGDLATGLLVGGLIAGGNNRYDRGYCGGGWSRGGLGFAEGYILGSRSSCCYAPCGPYGGYGYGYGYGGPYGGPWGGPYGGYGRW